MAIKEGAASWTGRRVLVTGAGGFIGSHLVEILVARGASVRAFVRYTSRGDRGWLDRINTSIRREVDVFVGDLVNPEAVAGALADCEVALHLGALIPIPYSYRHPREFVAANVTGTLNVLEASRREGVRRLVQVSSSEVYGSAKTVPIPEEHRLHPQSPYAATKVAADQLALSYARSFDLPVVVARPFNTFGPRQSARAVIPTIVTQALGRDRVELGTVETTRDFLYVADTVEGLARCAEVDGIVGEVFNLGTGHEYSIEDVVQRVLTATGREVPLELTEERRRPADSEVDRLCASVEKARTRLGWEPRVSFDQGLRLTIEWLSESLAMYQPEVYGV
ncbi:MAG TPA: GDP-mannose 4,6-dehydratase [Candidatus Limnocylindrales bacterium]|nr:GDP-mannose 4,6-dehydratase [Candidatus Limnocylindrales bacterium]